MSSSMRITGKILWNSVRVDIGCYFTKDFVRPM